MYGYLSWIKIKYQMPVSLFTKNYTMTSAEEFKTMMPD